MANFCPSAEKNSRFCNGTPYSEHSEALANTHLTQFGCVEQLIAATRTSTLQKLALL